MKKYVSTVTNMAVPYSEDPSGWVLTGNDHTQDVEREVLSLRGQGYTIVSIESAGCGDGGDMLYQNTLIEYEPDRN